MNPRQPPWQGGALPSELLPHILLRINKVYKMSSPCRIPSHTLFYFIFNIILNYKKEMVEYLVDMLRLLYSHIYERMYNQKVSSTMVS